MVLLTRRARTTAGATLILLAAAGAAAAGTHPRLGLYGHINGAGFPFILGGNRSGPLDAAMCDSVARFDEVILDASPISEYRPDVLTALRQRNPDISLLAYVLGHGCWPAAQGDSLVNYPTRYYRLVRDLDALLYDRAGNEYNYAGANVNLARRDAQGRFAFAEQVADLFYDVIVRPGIWDGMFLDVFCDRIAWSQTPGDSIDFVRAGYPSLAAFDDAWQAASDTLANRLRRLAGPGFLLVGNCAQGTKYAAFNGWMRENFHYQNGGNWDENMFRDPGGYFTDEARFRTPRHNYIFSAANPPEEPYGSDNPRRMRFGLGSASLGDGFGVFGYSSRSVSAYNYSTWWYDEYAVDLVSGRASGSRRHAGWLGQPRGPHAQMVWPGTGPDASSNPEFEVDVTTGWEFVAGVPATLTRDTVGAASGAASARVDVPVAGDYDWRVNLRTTGRLAVSAGQAHSATFWARASGPRRLRVSIGVPGGAALATRSVDLTTQWRRFQVVLIPGANASAALYFFLAGEAGSIWLDDVHLQPGVSNVWRRDFQNGVVLVNPATVPMAVTLERPFRRIAGSVDPLRNDGGTGPQVTVGAMDAVFLIGDDFIPPAPVTDLRPVPR